MVLWKFQNLNDFNKPEVQARFTPTSFMDVRNGSYHETVNISDITFPTEKGAQKIFTAFHTVFVDLKPKDNNFFPENLYNPFFETDKIDTKTEATISENRFNQKTALENEKNTDNSGITFQENKDGDCSINGIYSIYNIENTSRSSVQVFNCIISSEMIKLNQSNVSYGRRIVLDKPDLSIPSEIKFRKCYIDRITSTSLHVLKDNRKTVSECNIFYSELFLELILKNIEDELQESNLSYRNSKNITSFRIDGYGMKMNVSHISKPTNMQEVRFTRNVGNGSLHNESYPMTETFHFPADSAVSRLLLVHDNLRRPLHNIPSIEDIELSKTDKIISVHASTIFGMPDLQSYEDRQESASLTFEHPENDEINSFLTRIAKPFDVRMRKFMQVAEMVEEKDLIDFLSGKFKSDAINVESHKINFSDFELRQSNKSKDHCPICEIAYKSFVHSRFNKDEGFNWNNSYLLAMEKPEVIIYNISNLFDSKTQLSEMDQTQDTDGPYLSFIEIKTDLLFVPFDQSLQSENISGFNSEEKVIYDDPLSKIDFSSQKQFSIEDIIKESPDLLQDIEQVLLLISEEINKRKSESQLSFFDDDSSTGNEVKVSTDIIRSANEPNQMRYKSFPALKDDDDGVNLKKKEIVMENSHKIYGKTNIELLETPGQVYFDYSTTEADMLTNKSGNDAPLFLYSSDGNRTHVIKNFHIFKGKDLNATEEEADGLAIFYGKLNATNDWAFIAVTGNISIFKQLNRLFEELVKAKNAFDAQTDHDKLHATKFPTKKILFTGFAKIFQNDGFISEYLAGQDFDLNMPDFFSETENDTQEVRAESNLRTSSEDETGNYDAFEKGIFAGPYESGDSLNKSDESFSSFYKNFPPVNNSEYFTRLDFSKEPEFGPETLSTENYTETANSASFLETSSEREAGKYDTYRKGIFKQKLVAGDSLNSFKTSYTSLTSTNNNSDYYAGQDIYFTKGPAFFPESLITQSDTQTVNPESILETSPKGESGSFDTYKTGIFKESFKTDGSLNSFKSPYMNHTSTNKSEYFAGDDFIYFTKDLAYVPEALTTKNNTQTVTAVSLLNPSVDDAAIYERFRKAISKASFNDSEESVSSLYKYLKAIFEGRRQPLRKEQPIQEESFPYEDSENDETPIAYFTIKDPTVWSRSKRSPLPQNNWCGITTEVRHANIGCTVWTHKKECTITCHDGFTFDGKETEKVSCRRKENSWKPKFMSCEGSPRSSSDSGSQYRPQKWRPQPRPEQSPEQHSEKRPEQHPEQRPEQRPKQHPGESPVPRLTGPAEILPVPSPAPEAQEGTTASEEPVPEDYDPEYYGSEFGESYDYGDS